MFAIGLFKKTVFADTLAVIANGGFDSHRSAQLYGSLAHQPFLHNAALL